MDTGSEISVLKDSIYHIIFGVLLHSLPYAIFCNFDNLPIAMSGWIPNVSLHFNNKRVHIDLFMAKTTYSVLGMDAGPSWPCMDAISALRLTISCQLASVECQLPEPVSPSKNTVTLTLKT